MAVDHRTSQIGHPEVGNATLCLLALLETLNHRLSTPDALVGFRGVDQRERYVLHRLDGMGHLVAFPFALLGDVVDSGWRCQLPLAPKLPVRLGQLGAQTLVKATRTFPSVQ